MANLNQIEKLGVTYDLEDTACRSSVTELETQVEANIEDINELKAEIEGGGASEVKRFVMTSKGYMSTSERFYFYYSASPEFTIKAGTYIMKRSKFNSGTENYNFCIRTEGNYPTSDDEDVTTSGIARLINSGDPDDYQTYSGGDSVLFAVASDTKCKVFAQSNHAGANYTIPAIVEIFPVTGVVSPNN